MKENMQQTIFMTLLSVYCLLVRVFYVCDFHVATFSGGTDCSRFSYSVFLRAEFHVAQFGWSFSCLAFSVNPILQQRMRLTLRYYRSDCLTLTPRQ